MATASPSPGARSVAERRREDLAGQGGLVLAGDGEQLVVAAERERDPVLDGQAGRLARALDRVDHLAREALAHELRVERELEGDRVRALALELVAVQGLEHEQQVLRAQAVIVALDRDPDLPAVAQPRGHVAGVERRHRLRDLRHRLAEARARAPGSSA